MTGKKFVDETGEIFESKNLTAAKKNGFQFNLVLIAADKRENLGVTEDVFGLVGIAETAVEVARFRRGDVDIFEGILNAFRGGRNHGKLQHYLGFDNFERRGCSLC